MLGAGLVLAPMVGVGLPLALMLPFLDVDASKHTGSSFVPRAELRPRDLTLRPESTKAFLQHY